MVLTHTGSLCLMQQNRKFEPRGSKSAIFILAYTGKGCIRVMVGTGNCNVISLINLSELYMDTQKQHTGNLPFCHEATTGTGKLPVCCIVCKSYPGTMTALKHARLDKQTLFTLFAF